MTLSLVIGLGIAAFLLLYFSLSQAEEHVLLKLLGLFFFLSLLMLMPKALLDEDNAVLCENEVNSTITEGNLTTYTYAALCYSNGVKTSDTNTLFFKTISWFFRVFWIYIIVYFNWWFWLGRMVKENKTWGKMQRRLKGG